MARDQLIVGIDIGTTKMCTLIARVTEDEQLEVIGVGVTRSDALRKGVVVSVDQAAHDIQSSIEKAQQQSGFKILSAYVTISGSHIQSDDVHGTVTPRRADRPISDDDVEQVIDATRATNLPSDRELIEVIPRRFTVDGQHETDSPIGMLGHRLEVEATLLSGARSAIQNLTACVERTGVSIDALVPQSLASGEGGTLADRALVRSDADRHRRRHDRHRRLQRRPARLHLVAAGWRVPDHQRHRGAPPNALLGGRGDQAAARPGISNGRDEERTIDVATFDSAESSAVSIQTLTETIEDRLADTLERVRRRLAACRFRRAASGRRGAGGRDRPDARDSPARSRDSGVARPGGSPERDVRDGRPTWSAGLRGQRRPAEMGPQSPGLRDGGGPSSFPGSVGALMDWLRGFLP